MKQTRYVVYLSVLLAVIFLAACAPGEVEPGATGVSEVAAEPKAPEVGPVVPFGPPEIRDLQPTTETVPNCNGASSAVVKHPSITVGSAHSVEWEIGGSVGVGVQIGSDLAPASVNLEAALEGHVARDINNSIQFTNAWDLPADPGYVMEYTIMWREIWQPGYIDATFLDPEPEIMRINVRYRTGIQSDIVGDRKTRCDGGASATAAPTSVSTSPPVDTPAPTSTANPPSSSTFTVYSNLSWQDTGVMLQSGDSVRIIWDGTSKWRGINYGDYSDPLGSYDDPNANYACPPLLPVSEAGWNALVAKVGQNGVVTNPFKTVPSGQGTLYLAMNDCDQERYDNEGSVNVTIEVRR